MTFLHFPPGIVQDDHTHPSFRMGVIFRGKGWAVGSTGKYLVEPGSVFVIEEQEIHKFITEDDHMSVVSFHPDGDWGPTDHDHTILNRTYVGAK
jgi:quercetin dioxygenase-like cupin family protein